MEYEEGEFEITEKLVEYWMEGRVGQDSVTYNETEGTIEILWHSA